MADRRGLLIILSSPSGAGKSTLARGLMAWDDTLRFSVSATTRPPRPGEEHGREYYFLTQDAFRAQVDRGEMLEWAEVFGNRYGSPAGPVRDSIEAGRDVLFDVDWQGEQQIRNSHLGRHALSIFILPPSITELRRRLETRGQDSADVIADRMQKSWDEISHWGSYDYVLVNDDLEITQTRLRTIIEAERMRRVQQPKLTDHVRRLQTEFEEGQT
ncbi:MAG: guanylate kinase [Paracoccaceae bacterium]